MHQKLKNSLLGEKIEQISWSLLLIRDPVILEDSLPVLEQ